jgi:hypothetical protein
VARKDADTRRSLVLDPGLDKLQALLLAMEDGDEISVTHASKVSGLATSHCEAVLEALTRAGLMLRHDDAYVRTHPID